MRKVIIVFLCLVLLFLTGCAGEQSVYEPETSLKEKCFENPITVEDLEQLYLDNETVFEGIINELKKLPDDVYFVSFDNKLCFSNNIGKTVSPDIQYDYTLYRDCFEQLFDFADLKLKNEYIIRISKTDYGYSFNIRSLDMLIDYSIKYCEKMNGATDSFINIKGPWFVCIFGLV